MLMEVLNGDFMDQRLANFHSNIDHFSTNSYYLNHLKSTVSFKYGESYEMRKIRTIHHLWNAMPYKERSLYNVSMVYK